MKSPVIIKANKYGLVLLLNPDVPFSDILNDLENKFKDSRSGFLQGDQQIAVEFRDRELSDSEIDDIVNVLSESAGLSVACVIDSEGEDRSRKLAKEAEDRRKEEEKENNTLSDISAVPTYEPAKAPDEDEVKMAGTEIVSDDIGHFYRGTLRSGQSIEFQSSIVVIGDVNPGARIVARGNIIVIGSLKGAAYAGVNGNPNAFIIALDMDPMQLRIGNLYARSPDHRGPRKKSKSQVMQIAYVNEGNIFVQPISRDVLNQII